MEQEEKKTGKLVAMHPLAGVWMKPEDALPFFNYKTKNALKYLMNRIYSGGFPPGTLQNDHLGWWILIPHHAIEAKEIKLKISQQSKAS